MLFALRQHFRAIRTPTINDVVMQPQRHRRTYVFGLPVNLVSSLLSCYATSCQIFISSPLTPSFLQTAGLSVTTAETAASMPVAGDGEKAEYSRKDKSLSLLCESFMLYCSSAVNCPGGVVSLDTCAAQLGVERRRIYDVTNILEALDMVSRKTKNAYIWHGTSNMAYTIKMLRVRCRDLCNRIDDCAEIWPLHRILSHHLPPPLSTPTHTS